MTYFGIDVHSKYSEIFGVTENGSQSTELGKRVAAGEGGEGCQGISESLPERQRVPGE